MYPPANRCIYCGERQLPLSREHIIPYSLGGSLSLPRASCAVHASLTSKFEREVAQDTYGIHRAFEKTLTRRKDRHAKTLANLVTVEGIDLRGHQVVTQLPTAKVPRLPMVVRLQPPGILRGVDPAIEEGVTLHCRPKDEASLSRLREQLGWSKITVTGPTVRPRSFLQVLAKIAHAYACAELGEDFTPFLLPLILGEPVSGTYLVGGYLPELPQNKSPLLLREQDHQTGKLLVVEVSFHFFPELPRYLVVCGRKGSNVTE